MALLIRFFRQLSHLLATHASRRGAARRRADLAAACAELPEPARSIYLLSACDALPLAEIALRLRISPEAVEHELAKALVFLDRQDNAVAQAGTRG